MAFSLFVLRASKYGKVAWHFCKSNWQLVIATIIIGAVYLTSRSKNKQLAKTLSEMRESHREEVKVIQETYDKQIEDAVQAEKAMSETIKAVEAEYKLRNQRLDRKERKKIEQVIKESSDDPDLITKKISEITGFEIYVK